MEIKMHKSHDSLEEHEQLKMSSVSLVYQRSLVI